MKTTFDLSEPLLHKAKAVAARQGRPLRDLVADAIQHAVAEAERGARAVPAAEDEWQAFLSKLERQPDGSYINPDGIEDETFFEILETIRDERLHQQVPRDPFADSPAPAEKVAAVRKTRRG